MEKLVALTDKPWTVALAKVAAMSLQKKGYHFLVVLPHNTPGKKFEENRGKAPGYLRRDGMWATSAKWQDASITPNLKAGFEGVSMRTRFVPNIGILCGTEVQLEGGRAGTLCGIDIDADDQSLITAFDELFARGNPIRIGRRGGLFMAIVSDADASSRDYTSNRESKVQLLCAGILGNQDSLRAGR
jgi:hypothetical protein